MAQPDDNKSSPSLTRRTLMAGSAATALTPDLAFPHNATCQGEADPVLTLWTEWQKLNAEAEAWRTKWWKLEDTLFQTVGFPRVQVPTHDDASPTYVIDHDDIEDLLGEEPETAEMREQLHADLTSQQARWNAATASVELDATQAHYEAVDARARALQETTLKTPATSVVGIIAKLALVITTGQPSANDQQFPWPHLRCVLVDLRQLGASCEIGGTS